MKKKIVAILSLLLSTVMILSTLGVMTIFAEANTVEYYVAPNGTGNGKSAQSPAESITKVMQTIIDDGHDAEDNVTIYVAGGEGATAVPSGGLALNVTWPWPQINNADATTQANITITSMPDANAPAILEFGGTPLVVMANTTFKNITLLDCNGENGIFTNGYNVTFEEDVIFKKGTSVFSDYAPNIYIGSGYNWGVRNDDAGTLIINNISNNKRYSINFGGYTWNGEGEAEANYLNGNKTIIINGGTVENLYLVGFKRNAEYNSNISVVLNGAKINNLAVSAVSGYAPVINGSVQFVANGTTLPDMSAIISYADANSIPYYILNSTSNRNGLSGLLTATDTVGTYTVKSGEIATAINVDDSSKVYTSQEELLTLPSGIYFVTCNNVGAAEETYYVQYGGTGDGLSPESPLATVDDAVKAANAAGLTYGDTVYINVMQSEDWNWGAGTIGAGDNYRSDAHHITTWASRGTLTAHTAKIVVQGYGEGDVYLASNAQLGLNLDMVLGGPTEFNNVTIVRMRRWRGIFANGYDVTYGENTKIGVVNVDDCSSTFVAWNGNIDLSDGVATYSLGNVNKISNGGGGIIEFKNAPAASTVNISSTADIWTSGTATGPSAAVETYKKDVSIIFNNSKFSGNIEWGNSNGGGTLLEKNLNINAKSVNSLSYTKGKGSVTINGDLQIIAKIGVNAADIPDNVTINGSKWIISVADASDLIDFTDTSGAYTVKDGITVVATDLNDIGKIYTSVDGVLTLPEGSYQVNRQKSTFVEATYYVQYGGTGDGLSPETPLATVDDAVKAANAAGLTAGDTVYINIMQSKDWNWGAGTIGAGDNYRSDAHHITTWASRGTLTAHTAKIVVQGYGEGDVYLASNAQLGLNLDMILGGPTEFNNVTIVRMRRWRGIFANGYDVTYGENTKIGVVNVDDCSSTFVAWNGNIDLSDGVATYSLGNINKISNGGGGIIEFKNAPAMSTINISSTADIWISGTATGPSAAVETYKKDVSIILNNSKFSGNIEWGNANGGGTLFEKNLNINAKTIKYLSYTEGKGSVTINGDLQIIAKIGINVANIPENVTVNGDKWFISNGGGAGFLDLTDKSGTYIVKEGFIAVATDLNDPTKTYTSVDGVLTIPAGTYLVTRVTPGGAEGTYYVKYGGTGDGLSKDNPLATVEDAVNAANDEGYGVGDTVYINVIQSDDWNWGAGVIGAGSDYRADPHHMTTWAERGKMPTHRATIVVQGVGDNTNQPIYLASNGQIGLNLDMIMGGPTVFKNISIVMMRRWRAILANGYDVTFEDKTMFGSFEPDDCSSTFMVWDGKVNCAASTTQIGLGNPKETMGGDGGNITFNNNPADLTLAITSPYEPSSEVEIYKNNVTITYNHNQFVQRLKWGHGNDGSALFEKNLRINILAASKLSYLKGEGTVTVNGGLEIISNVGEVEELDITAIPSNVTVKGGKWFITNYGNSELQYTDVAGTYMIKDGKQATAINVDTKKKYESKSGILVLPEGEYVIEETDDGIWWNESDIVDGEVVGKALFSGSFKDSEGKPIKNIKLKLVSDEDIYLADTDANGKFNFKEIKEGFYELFVIDDAGNEYFTGYASSLFDGDIISLNLVINNSNSEITVSNKNGIVKGNVYTPQLKPVANLKVYLGEFGSVVTDKNGYFEFTDVPAGEYDVYTFMTDGSRQIMRSLEVKESTELSMKLKYESDKTAQSEETPVLWWIIISVGAVVLVVASILFIVVKNKRKAAKA